MLEELFVKYNHHGNEEAQEEADVHNQEDHEEACCEVVSKAFKVF
jgi:hypothetical protein